MLTMRDGVRVVRPVGVTGVVVFDTRMVAGFEGTMFAPSARQVLVAVGHICKVTLPVEPVWPVSC